MVAACHMMDDLMRCQVRIHLLQEVDCCEGTGRVSFSDLNPQLIFTELHGKSFHS
jgi:hypothetical protein